MLNVAALPPTVTPVTKVKLLPVIVRAVPPVTGPLATERASIAGSGA